LFPILYITCNMPFHQPFRRSFISSWTISGHDGLTITFIH